MKNIGGHLCNDTFAFQLDFNVSTKHFSISSEIVVFYYRGMGTVGRKAKLPFYHPSQPSLINLLVVNPETKQYSGCFAGNKPQCPRDKREEITQFRCPACKFPKDTWLL